MKKQLNQVQEFNEAFGIEYSDKPTLIESKDWFLRFRLLQEELDEYADACGDGDLTEVADALGDMLYVLCGTILAHGMQDKIEEVFDEIHRSNMSKLENGKPIYREDKKVLKGKDYFPPNIKAILDK